MKAAAPFNLQIHEQVLNIPFRFVASREMFNSHIYLGDP